MFQHTNGFAGRRHEVNAAGVEGMTLGQSLERKPQAFHAAVFPDSFNAVGRTGRIEATAIAEQR
jgi:hypothetical protein